MKNNKKKLRLYKMHLKLKLSSSLNILENASEQLKILTLSWKAQHFSRIVCWEEGEDEYERMKMGE